MRKIILILFGAALIASSTTQAAFCKQRHHIRNARQVSNDHFGNAKACPVPSYVPDPGSVYTGAAGAWATMTGFN